MTVLVHQGKSFGKKTEINEAVGYEIEPESYYEFNELSTKRLENASKMLGRLIETLHESHCLTDEQMLQVIGGSWEIVK